MMLMMMLMMMMTTMMKLMTQMLLLTKSLNNEASAVHVFCGFECYISLWHICNVTYSCLQLCIDLSVNLQAGVEHATQQWTDDKPAGQGRACHSAVDDQLA